MNDTDTGPVRAPEALEIARKYASWSRHLAELLAAATASSDPDIEALSLEDAADDIRQWQEADGFDYVPRMHTVVPAPVWLNVDASSVDMQHRVAAVGFTYTRHVWALTTCGLWLPIEQPVPGMWQYVLKARLTNPTRVCDHPRLGDRTS